MTIAFGIFARFLNEAENIVSTKQEREKNIRWSMVTATLFNYKLEFGLVVVEVSRLSRVNITRN